MRALVPLVAVLACTVAANLSMKAGSNHEASPLLLGFVPWRTLCGLTAFACAGLFYARVLRFVPLNVAQSFGAAQVIALSLASRLVLGKLIPLTRWVGVSMIMIGRCLVRDVRSRSQNPETNYGAPLRAGLWTPMHLYAKCCWFFRSDRSILV